PAAGQAERSLDPADEAYRQRAMQGALERGPSGETATWRNPANGHSGTVTPVTTYRSVSGQYCRDFQATVTAGGGTDERRATACRLADGAWKLVGIP
ncbi:MAG: RT0821/Lpp0805 family surface protein, partial [Alphaproteobacteria bacterium]